MLFGLGFALQFTRGHKIELDFLTIYSKRLTILLVMGLLHTIVIWFGDILHVYALVGFVLLLIRNLSDKVILRWAVTIAVAAGLMPFLHWIIPIDVAWGPEALSPSERFDLLTSAQWSDIVAVNWNFNHTEYTRFSLQYDETIYWYLSVLWKFMIGFVLGRRLMLQNTEKYLPVYRRFLPWGLTIGIGGSAILFVTSYFYEIWIPVGIHMDGVGLATHRT